MVKVLLGLIAVLVVLVLGGGAYLATVDPPVTRQRVEQVLPNDRFAQ